MPQLTDGGVLEPPDVTIRRIPRLCSRAFRLGGDRQDRARTSDFLADGGCVARGRSAVGRSWPFHATRGAAVTFERTASEVGAGFGNTQIQERQANGLAGRP
jgi:hypothetical protein